MKETQLDCSLFSQASSYPRGTLFIHGPAHFFSLSKCSRKNFKCCRKFLEKDVFNSSMLIVCRKRDGDGVADN